MSRSIGDLGEFVLIDQVTARLPQGPGVVLGPGDDAAILAVPDGRIVVSTDLLVEDRHFRREWSGPYDIGRKAAAQNLADIAAMGARPTALLVGLAAPAQLDVSWVLAFADGLRDECDLVGASVVGGDISSAANITLGITALGDLEGRQAVTRAGARAGDLVVLAGRLGWAAAGLALLRKFAALPAPALPAPAVPAAAVPAAAVPAAAVPAAALADLQPLIAAHRRPEPPYGRGRALARAGATAMCDVSDGLMQDLGHIAAASGVRVEVSAAALPVPPLMARAAAVLGVDPRPWIFAGGDDHALVAALPAGAAVPDGCAVIGQVGPGDGVWVDGEPYTGSAGHDHFG